MTGKREGHHINLNRVVSTTPTVFDIPFESLQGQNTI